jgi:hypothetical protein
VSAPVVADGGDSDALFGRLERWGWEYRDITAQVQPYRQPPALPVLPIAPWAGRTALRQYRSRLPGVARLSWAVVLIGVGTLFLRLGGGMDAALARAVNTEPPASSTRGAPVDTLHALSTLFVVLEAVCNLAALALIGSGIVAVARHVAARRKSTAGLPAGWWTGAALGESRPAGIGRFGWAVVLICLGAVLQWVAGRLAAARTSPLDLNFAGWSIFFYLAAVLLGSSAAVAIAGRGARLQRLERARVAWLTGAVAANERHFRAQAGWLASLQEHREQADQQAATARRWFGIQPSTAHQHVDLFGGTAEGWRAYLLTAGSAVLGCGGRLHVVDLSDDDVSQPLREAARRAGYSCSLVELPAAAGRLDALAGLTPDTVADLLVTTVHGQDREIDHERQLTDARILTDICRILAAPLSIARISAALRVVQRRPDPAAECLSEVECDRLLDTFGETFRRTAESRIAALEAMLHRVSSVGADIGTGEAAPEPDARLQVVAVRRGALGAADALLSHLVAQLLIHRLAAVDQGSRTLVLAGVDILKVPQVERLDQVARRYGIRLVCLYRHLRDDAEKLLGGGDMVVFMRLGNAQEASNAAEFIGREYKFVIHQTSLSDTSGTSSTQNFSEQVSTGKTTSPGFLPNSTNVNRSKSLSTSTGSTDSLADSASRQRVYEFAVEPGDLQSLPPTMFVFIDPARRRGPRARVGECNPLLAGLPVAAECLPAGQSGEH